MVFHGNVRTCVARNHNYMNKGNFTRFQVGDILKLKDQFATMDGSGTWEPKLIVRRYFPSQKSLVDVETISMDGTIEVWGHGLLEYWYEVIR